MKTNMAKSFAVECDWLTLATYHFRPYTKFAAFLREVVGMDWKGSKWLQYAGFTNGDGIFYGHATQSNMKEHYIIKITGRHASTILPQILEQPFAPEFYATRIDVQRTIEAPKWWKPREVKDWLDIHGRTSSMVESERSTIYIGNRRSGRFCRLYEKDYVDKYLRLEIELKKEHARNAWDYLLEGTSVRSIYASHLTRLPLAQSWYESFVPSEFDSLDLSLKTKQIEAESQYDWLLTMVPTFQRMSNDHDIGERVRAVFYSLWYLNEDDKNDYID